MLNAILNLSSKIFDKDIEKIPTRKGYGEGVVEAGENDKNIVVLTADLSESTQSHLFAKKFPERFIECGVAEQNMAGIAAGLALSGKVPFMTSYSIFSPGLNWLTIRTSICYSQANVKIVSSHSGLSAGPDGATHQALEDIALMRVLPNMTVIVPADYNQAKKATLAVAKHIGPVYIRVNREATPVFTTLDTPFEIGKAQILMEGNDLTILACGPIVYNALEAAKNLAHKNGGLDLKPKIKCEVINVHTTKPLDEKTILESVKKTGQVITVEEHQIAGGLGSAVCELLSEKFPAPVKRLGIKDTFGESGTYEELLDKFGLSMRFLEKEIIAAVGVNNIKKS